MEIKPKQSTVKGPAETFTGDVWYDVIAKGEEPSRIRVNTVRFSPGARSAWHSHALGQTFYVTEGAGFVQSRGGDVVVQPIAVGELRARRLHDPPLHHRGRR